MSEIKRYGIHASCGCCDRIASWELVERDDGPVVDFTDLQHALAEKEKALEHGNDMVRELRQRIAQLEGNCCIQLDTIIRLRADHEADVRRIADLEGENRQLSETNANNVGCYQMQVQDLEAKLAKCRELLRECDESEIHSDGCFSVTGSGPCNCLMGRIRAALADLPAEAAEKEEKEESNG